MTSRSAPGRLWFPLVAVVGAACFNAWNWWGRETSTQGRVMSTGASLLVAGLLLVVWALFLARLSARVRLRMIGAGAVLSLLLFASVELRGVDGDLVPILGWRWNARLAELPTAEPEEGDARSERTPHLNYSQFLGEQRDGVVRGVRLVRDWSAHPPREVWRREVGAGWSSFAVEGHLAITQEQHGHEEAIVAYDLATGDVRWVHAHTDRYATDIGGEGPRATPTISGDRVFAMGSNAWLDALELKTGELLWERRLLETDDVPDWGFSGSPLVLGDLVIVNPCGSVAGLMALEVATGAEVWRTAPDAGGYSSPAHLLLHGEPQVLIAHTFSLSAHGPADGRKLWSVPWGSGNPNVAQPVAVPGDRVAISSGYGTGAALLRIDRDAEGRFVAEEEWRSRSLKAKFANFMLRDGYLYGLDDGILTCVDSSTGRRAWKGGRYGHGQILLVDDLLRVTSEEGELILVEADPTEHRELARIDALSGRAWNSQAFAAPWLLLRNDREAVCYEISLDGDLPD